MIIIIQILLRNMMTMIIIHQQIYSSGRIDKKMFVNGYVINVSMLIKVQIQFVKIANKANNLQVKVELYIDHPIELHRQLIIHLLRRIHLLNLGQKPMLGLIMTGMHHLHSIMMIDLHLELAQHQKTSVILRI